jgi:hypothetical protein
MARFRFDVYENGVLTPDDEGLDLLSVEAARLEAARAAAEMLRDRALDEAAPADIEVVARNETGELFRVTVTLKIGSAKSGRA